MAQNKVKWLVGIVLVVLVVYFSFIYDFSDQPTVDELDLERYSGVWYEVASFPSWFQRNLVNVTATYTLNDDGTVGVLNQGYDVETRELRNATAVAKLPDPDKPGELKVYFNRFIGGDYYVLEVGKYYEYALVGSRNYKYLWILSRDPVLSDNVFNGLVERAEEIGYDVSKLEKKD